MLKRSKQREAIVRVLKRTSSHPTAEWIYEEVKKEIPNIGLATVYRNLRLLKEAGMAIPRTTIISVVIDADEFLILMSLSILKSRPGYPGELASK